ncbi:MAG: DNA-binding response regulator [Peptococcaceae bacterium]|nr:MAG: DNA-binding response regulator [Peptococcaceae bacterium]
MFRPDIKYTSGEEAWLLSRQFKILIADDEQKIREVARMYLEKEGFAVGEAADGQETLDCLAAGKWDLLVLDLMMPKRDGWDVCREVRKISNVPIIMLTAREAEIDRVLGLELGADDYVVKPFSPRELVARVKAVLRRTGKVEEQGERKDKIKVLHYSNITIDPSSRAVAVLDQPVSLTPKEFELLYYMANSPGRVFSREKLLEAVWGYEFFGDARTVDTHVNRLREKLARVSGSPSFITTVWGVGYKFEVAK